MSSTVSLTDGQAKVFASFCAGANLYLTGKGGSGKSYLTRYIIDWCKSAGKKVIVCAPTGVAAQNVGGSTLHRTFAIPSEILSPKKSGRENRCYNKKKLETLAKADVLVIDEISMCRIDVFEYVARTLFSLPRKPQLLLVGDFYQLPPVLTNEDEPAFSVFFQKRLYAFESQYWTKLQLHTMELQESMRQSDKAFVKALDSIREGCPDFDVFAKCDDRVDPEAITICGRNRDAANQNKKQLAELIRNGAEEFEYKAKVTGEVKEGDWTCEKALHLCVGARVMMLNNDRDKRWINGSLGIVSSVDPLCVKMEETGRVEEIDLEEWHISEYVIEENKKGEKELVMQERGSISQYPVKPAWAISIHKSQGQTYEKANVNIKNIFACGQLYVALSRCKSLKGLHIIGELKDEKVIVADVVKAFMAGAPIPSVEGPMLPFVEDSVNTSPSVQDPTQWPEVFNKKSNRDYQEGYQDGYSDGTTDVEERYLKMLSEDPGAKKLGKYARREHEKELEPEENRNPKRAGRKPVEGLRKKNKVVRVPEEIYGLIKDLADKLQLCSEEQIKEIQEKLSDILKV